MTIDRFHGEFAFLSNFYHPPFLGQRLHGYNTTEHFFQAMKTLDEAQREVFKDPNMSPAQAKRHGQDVTLRDDWEDIKDAVMLHALRRKFHPESTMAQRLLDTGHESLVEGNHWHDNYWGRCYCNQCGNVGRNQLGWLLEQVRSELRSN